MPKKTTAANTHKTEGKENVVPPASKPLTARQKAAAAKALAKAEALELANLEKKRP